jgi:hypothetical protein
MINKKVIEAVFYKFTCDCGKEHTFTQKIDALLFICWKCNNPLDCSKPQSVKFKRQKRKETENERRNRLMKHFRD